MRRLGAIGLCLLILAPAIPSAVDAKSRPDAGPKPLSVCQDSNGVRRVADLDVILLMDNSKSLETTKKGARPTDPDGLRFRAVRDLLVSLEGLKKGSSQQKGVPINFGMISFGSKAQIEIPIQPLGDANSLADEVKSTLPALQQVTDYIGALKRAMEVLSKRPAENCKFLVWFTDGQFESSEIAVNDRDRARKIAAQANRLQEEVCSSGGLADQFHDARINTFVLVLRPSKTDERLDVSYGAMQAITGAYGEGEVPADVAKGKRGDLCGNIATRDHLGEILVAEDASSIARKVPTIANIIDDWDEVTACPVSSEDDVMPAMPAARHLAKLSFTAYEKGRSLDNLGDAVIIDVAGKEHPFSDYLTKDSSSEFEQKYSFNASAIKELNQGWTFAIKSGEVGWCVQMLAQKFEIEFTSDDSQPVREVSPGDLLTPEDIASFTYRTAAGAPIRDVNAARSESSEVTAFLEIDPTKELFKEPMPVTVRQLKVPLVLCEKIALTAAEPMPKERAMAASCDIDTSNTTLGTVKLSLVQGDSLGAENCGSSLGLVLAPQGGPWDPAMTGAGEVDHKKGAATVHVVLKAKGRSASCKSLDGTNLSIDYSSGTQVEPITVPVIVDVEWRKVPRAWVVGVLVALLLLLVILLNLLLLRLLTRSGSLLPRFGMDAYEVPVLLVREPSGRVKLQLRDRSPVSTVTFDLGQKIVVEVAQDRRSASLRGGSRIRLVVKNAPVHRPLGQAYLTIESVKSARFWEAVAGGKGISPLAGTGAILHSPQPTGEQVEAIVTILLPRNEPDRQRYIREVLGMKLSNAIQDTATDVDWLGGAGGAPSAGTTTTPRVPTDAGAGINAGPQPPQPPRPPAPPPRA